MSCSICRRVRSDHALTCKICVQNRTELEPTGGLSVVGPKTGVFVQECIKTLNCSRFGKHANQKRPGMYLESTCFTVAHIDVFSMNGDSTESRIINVKPHDGKIRPKKLLTETDRSTKAATSSTTSPLSACSVHGTKQYETPSDSLHILLTSTPRCPVLVSGQKCSWNYRKK